MSGRSTLLGAFALSVVAGCYSTDEGPSPPSDSLYFPVALAVSTDATALYAINSDFDLQFNGGTVQAYDLAALRSRIPPLWQTPAPGASVDSLCGALGANPSPILYPGVCGPIDAPSLVTSTAKIGAFATDALLLDNPEPDGVRSRLFVPVRGDPSLTYFDLASPLALDCGQAGNGGSCDAAHRLGTDASDNTRGLTMPTEPFHVAAIVAKDDLGGGKVRWQQAIGVTHQTSGAVSLFTGDGSAGDSLFQGRPRLEFVLGGLPAGASGIAAVPYPASISHAAAGFGNYLPPYQPGFLVTFRNNASVALVRYFSDAYSSPARPFLNYGGSVPMSVNAAGYDSRGIVVDSQARTTCEASCANDTGDALTKCLETCEGTVPVPVYVANRVPPTLIIGQLRTNVSAARTDDLVDFYDSVPVGQGASQVVVGDVLGADGQRHRRVFVVCFDSRSIYVYDPQARRSLPPIRTGRGPSAIALDVGSDYAFGYVAHFTDSYIGVVDLNEAHAETFLTMVATVGAPSPPRETQ